MVFMLCMTILLLDLHAVSWLALFEFRIIVLFLFMFEVFFFIELSAIQTLDHFIDKIKQNHYVLFQFSYY